MEFEEKYKETSVESGKIEHLIKDRVPWLFLGLLVGIIATLMVSEFESVLSSNIYLAFFIPVIVYLADAVGTQSETIYIRALSKSKREKIEFIKYLLKESAVGLGLGAIFGFLLGVFTFYWLNSYKLALAIGVTVLINLTIAPVLAVIIPKLIHKNHSDPALGAGPVATIIQDSISILIYFFVTNLFT